MRFGVILFYCLLIGTWTNVYSLDTIRVFTADSQNKIIGGIKIQVDRFGPFTSDNSGFFEFFVEDKLEMPFEVTTISKGYKTLRFSYYQDEGRIQVVVEKLLAPIKNAEFTYILKTPGTIPLSALSNIKCQLRGQVIYANNVGVLKIQEPITNNKDFQITGFNVKVIKQDENDKNTFHVELIKDSQLEKNTYGLTPSHYNQYKEDIEFITHEIQEERIRLTEQNEKIRLEILAVTQQLEKDTSLTIQERNELKDYQVALENEFEENSRTHLKVEEKTRNIISRLKIVIWQKDSIQQSTNLQLSKEKEKRFFAERKNKRSFIIFSIIVLFLLLLAMFFYIIARRMRLQRSELRNANNALLKSKEQLENSLLDLSKQQTIIEEKNSQLETFAYRASHDIKGPLKTIKGLSDIGLSTSKEKESFELFDYINKTVIKLENMVTDILMFAKDSKSKPNNSKFLLANIITSAINDLKSQESFEGIDFQILVSSEQYVNFDKTLFTSVVQNLIENAIKYSDRGKKSRYLIVRSSLINNNLIISFEDNGIGIESALHEKIFTSFFRKSTDTKGTGLGLYIVKQNILKLGGEIKVESVLGQGSTFIVTIPMT